MMLDYDFSGHVLCMGSNNMDLVMFMEKLPLPGQTLLTDNFNMFPGGKGGNQAVTAATLGAQVEFFGMLGDDEMSSQLLNELTSKGIGIEGIKVRNGSTAGVAMIWVDSKGENSITFTPGANVLLREEDVELNENMFQQGAILLITMEIDPKTVYAAIRMAKKHGMFVILDPAPAQSEKIPDDIPKLIDIVKPNETEAEWLTDIKVVDEESAKLAVQKLLDMGFKHPIVTLGSKGAVVNHGNDITVIEPYSVETIDSTAAGDVFSGALAAALSKKMTYGQSLEFAKKAAALSTTRKGAQTSVPKLNEVEEIL
jgi:ribokinase